MSGFITIERGIWNHPLFERAPMTEREAWMWMIAQAAWADTRHRVGREMVDVPRGSFMATLREMQSVFMWKSDKRVRTFLKTLQKEGMIGRTTVGARNAPKTHVTICNYEEYQSRGRTKDAPKTHERTHHGRTTDAVKEQGNKGTIEESSKELFVHGDTEDADFLSDGGVKRGLSVVSPASPAFEQFWNVWPSKTAKQKAVASWKKLSEKDKHLAISEALPWFEKWRRQYPTASPIHASTWLNNKRWEDEFETEGYQNGHQTTRRNFQRNSDTQDPALRAIASAATAFQASSLDRREG